MQRSRFTSELDVSFSIGIKTMAANRCLAFKLTYGNIFQNCIVVVT